MSTTVTDAPPLPPDVTRQYSFTDHSVNAPSTPQPGDRLDAEFDRTNSAVNQITDFLEQTFDAEGNLLPGSVTLDRIDPHAVADIQARVTPGLQPFVDRAQTAAAGAEVERIDAEDAAEEAMGHAEDAASAAATARAANQQAQQAQAAATTAAAATADEATSASNYANDAEDSANRAFRDARLAGAWAEWMDGGSPIPDMFFAHTSVTGQHWSSRWWATQAAAAFGSMASLYLGAWPTPPTSTITGQPIPIGAIYYNTTTNQPYVWDGAHWNPFYAPTKALTLSLTYVATADQTVFPLTTPDITGSSYTMDPTYPEPIEAYVNGNRTIYDAPAGQGDFTVDPATSTLTFTKPLYVGSIVTLNVLAPVTSLAPSRVTTTPLLDFDIDPATGNPGQIDGVKKAFTLAKASTPHDAVTVSSNVEILVFLDGVAQQPGIAYSVSGSTITFTEAPTPGTVNWTLWYAPGAPAVTTATASDCCPLGAVAFTILPTPPSTDWRALDASLDLSGTDLGALGVPAPAVTPPAGTYAYVRVNQP